MNPQFYNIALIYASLSKNRTAKYIAEIAAQLCHIPIPIHCDTIPLRELADTDLSKYQALISIQVNEEHIRSLLSFNGPIVSIHDCHFPKLPVSQISWDNVAIGHLSGEFFLEKGLKHFAYLDTDRDQECGERCKGFVEAVQLAGHKVEVFPSDVFSFHPSNSNFFDANKALNEWINSLVKPTALLISQESMAHEFVSYCQRIGVSIPEEIQLLSVGNDEMICGLSTPAISSVELDYKNAAIQAIQSVKQSFENKTIPVPLVHKSFEPIEIIQRRSTSATAVTNVYVSRAVDLIHNFATSGITVDELSTRLNVSRSYLERSFRQQIGRSPGTEIRRTKLILVKQLLQDSKLSVSEIAEKTGFPHQEYLYVAFKRRYKMTPLQYRRRISSTYKSSTKHENEIISDANSSHPSSLNLACA